MKTCPICKQRIPIDKQSVKDIYLLCKEGFSLSEIAKEFDVSRQVVYAIKNKFMHVKTTDEIDKKLKKRRLIIG